MSKPRISIIIPTLNQGQYIESAIHSILQQGYSDLQVIVIDGGSSDNTLQIIEKYRGRINYFVSEKDTGQTEAINKGLKVADGDIITWLNSNDYYEPGTFDAIIPFFNEPATGIVFGMARVFGKKLRPQVVGPKNQLSVHLYLPYMRVPQPAMFFSAQAIKAAAPLNQNLHYAMDFQLTAKILLAGFGIKRIDRLLSNYRFHENSKSNLNHKFLQEWTAELHDIFCVLNDGRFIALEMELLFSIPPVPRSTYQSKIHLNREQLTEIFLEHLDLHFHYAYRDFNKSEMERIAGYLQRKHPEYYRLKNYHRYLNRVKIIPGFLLKQLRKITRL